jgi:Rrf2 family protein
VQVSKRCEYALRALIDIGIAHEAGREVLPIGELARHEQIPVRFLEQILLQLKDAGWLESRRGKSGGYALRAPMDTIRMGDVVRLVDGPLAPIRCVSKTAYEPCTCPDEDHCGLRMLMMDVRNALADVLDRHTLSDVVEVTLRRLRRDRLDPPFAVPRR